MPLPSAPNTTFFMLVLGAAPVERTVAVDSVSVTHKNDGLLRCSQNKSQQVFSHFFFNVFFLHCFLHFLHCFLHLPFTSSQFFILHLLVSVRPPHLSSGADGGGADGGSASHRSQVKSVASSVHVSSVGGSEGGGADGGSASHWSQVFLHCFFSSSEYFFLHFDFLQVKSVALSVHVSSGGGESGGGEGLGGGGDGDGGEGLGGGGEGLGGGA
eukprot:scaffold75930_cov66-Phaeocystis_antarctica.AAC.1